MSGQATEIKTMNVRIAKDLWLYLKNESAHQGKPMCELISQYVSEMKRKSEIK